MFQDKDTIPSKWYRDKMIRNKTHELECKFNSIGIPCLILRQEIGGIVASSTTLNLNLSVCDYQVERLADLPLKINDLSNLIYDKFKKTRFIIVLPANNHWIKSKSTSIILCRTRRLGRSSPMKEESIEMEFKIDKLLNDLVSRYQNLKVMYLNNNSNSIDLQRMLNLKGKKNE